MSAAGRKEMRETVIASKNTVERRRFVNHATLFLTESR
jgi:hypothetical protein